MAVRVGINGMGRIGRTFWRVSRSRPELDVVAINDLAPAANLAYLMKYDSVRGRFPAEITSTPDAIVVDGVPIAAYQEAEPDRLPWGDLGVDVVLEATGRFFTADRAAGHLRAGAGRVLVSTATVDADATVLMGVNEDAFDRDRHRIVSPGCCTSSAVVPVLAVLRQLGELKEGTLTTVHAYDATKSALLDSPHWNPRMGRAAAANLIPVQLKPGSLHAMGLAVPEIAGRVDGLHVRVPTIIGCLADLVVRMPNAPSAEAVNVALAAAAAGHFKGVLGYTEEPVVSSDIVGTAESSIVDGQFTTVVGDTVKVVAWYDNEWGFAHRLADVTGLLG
ncbi:MAG: type I glyceraldehyde-3-phosphate dehydrogenase [Hamadaea sp.]|uniref:type I glyceraldehyde-3-phosphate dehydrogenase n=1 Tax=Hamadaea sp. TaxID=2024425 RepID=UPI0017DDD236|nr:glyceraldehyde 3-phosphate dehydrogenase NAD-binding domain-containing protein [Hamadaea sp.]NUR71573.1 type I glyceraldehyde-3-phosphate dehydrogenase [Hamadaea sp.]NUT17898.1 type I glyceraldehyde-3-phosphate dehydrogenase [Hamadaea sp.]